MAKDNQHEAGEGTRHKKSGSHRTESSKKVRHIVKKMYMRAFLGEKPVAWLMYSDINEFLLAMDVACVYPENYGALNAAKQAGGYFIERAEAEGYSDVICSYARIGLGYAAEWRDTNEIPAMAPDGGMAKPAFMVGSNLGCDARYKWFQAFSRYVDAPYYAFDLLAPEAESVHRADIRDRYVKYTTAQLRGLVDFMERVLGKKIDWDKLEEAVRLGETANRFWGDAYVLGAKSVPCCFPVGDAFSCIAPGLFMKGEPATVEFYQGLYNEVKHRADNNMGVLKDEKYRLGFVGGPPPWHSMGIFDYVEDQDAVFAAQTVYGVAREIADVPDTITDPIERKAHAWYQRACHRAEESRRIGAFGICDHTGFGGMLGSGVDPRSFKLDGLVIHLVRSCRGLTIGQIYQKMLLDRYMELPALFIESDMADARNYFESDWKARLDYFLDTVRTRKESGS